MITSDTIKGNVAV